MRKAFKIVILSLIGGVLFTFAADSFWATGSLQQDTSPCNNVKAGKICTEEAYTAEVTSYGFPVTSHRLADLSVPNDQNNRTFEYNYPGFLANVVLWAIPLGIVFMLVGKAKHAHSRD